MRAVCPAVAVPILLPVTLPAADPPAAPLSVPQGWIERVVLAHTDTRMPERLEAARRESEEEAAFKTN